MTELKPEARAALDCLRRELGTDEERERVRDRLATLGLVTASAGAVALASSAAASSVGASGAAASAVGASGAAASAVGASGAPPALAVAGAGAAAQGASGLGTAAGGTLGSVGTSAAAGLTGVGSTAPTGLALAAAGSLKVGATTTLVSGLTAKLVAVPLALKATVVGVALVTSATVPLAMSSRSVQTAEREVAAAVDRARHKQSAPALLGQPNIVRPAVESSASDASPLAPTLRLAPPPVQPPSASPATGTEALSSPRGVRPRKRASAPVAPSVAEVSTLADEGALLERALRAMRAGDLDETRSILDEHERRHGLRAQLARERERIRAELTQRTR